MDNVVAYTTEGTLTNLGIMATCIPFRRMHAEDKFILLRKVLFFSYITRYCNSLFYPYKNKLLTLNRQNFD